MSKYRSRKVKQNGMTFDSVKEYRRFCELSQLEKEGKIICLRRQQVFELIPAQREPDTVGKRGGIKKGKLLERRCVYIADFVYSYPDGSWVVEDTKGIRTADYIIKRKLMLMVHGIRIKET